MYASKDPAGSYFLEVSLSDSFPESGGFKNFASDMPSEFHLWFVSTASAVLELGCAVYNMFSLFLVPFSLAPLVLLRALY